MLTGLCGQIAVAITYRQSEAALRKSEDRYRSLFEDSKDAIFITTGDGTILDVNQAMLELFGYHRSETNQVNRSGSLLVKPEGWTMLQR